MRAAGKTLATLNFGVASAIDVQHAIAKLEEAGDPNGAFTRIAMYRLPAVDRLALKMASNEAVERRAMHGELAALHSAWNEAEKLPAISHALFADEIFKEFKRQCPVRQAQADKAESAGRDRVELKRTSLQK